MNFAASVEILKLDSHGVEEAHKISSGTYIRLIQQLKGRPLFPQLKRLYIENYHGLVDYFSLFLSSNLQTIQLFNTQPLEKPGAISPVVLESLLCDFSEWSPGVQLLRITQDTTMPISLLDSISLLSNLRTLDLALVQVGSFEEFRPLAPLVLESFTLKLSCSSYTRLPNPITPLPDFLASLERLHISGPLIAVSDFVRSLGSQHLTSLVVRDEDIFSPRWDQRRKGKKSSTLTEAEDVKQQMYDFGSMVHTISLRWGHFLRTVTIASSCNARVDFAQLSGMPLLEKLCIFDCPVDGLEHTLKPSAVWYYLDTLHLTVTITFPLLSLIALSAPHLKRLGISIDTSEAPPTENRQILAHPLNLLRIHDPSSGVSCWSASDFSELPRFIQIARYLDALFPTMKELTSTSQIKTWETVWQLIVLCQTSRADDNCRRPVQTEFEVV